MGHIGGSKAYGQSAKHCDSTGQEGRVLQNCTFTADPAYYPVRNTLKSYLGRPWKEYSRTIIMESYLDDLIQPQGWLPWNETFALETLFYAEFNNRGPAAPKAQRIKWPGVKELPSNRVERFTAAEFICGDEWIPSTGVPYAPGFIFSVPKEDPNVKYSPVVPEENKDLGKSDQKESYIPSEKKDKDKDEDKKKGKDDDEDEDKKKDRHKDSDKKKDSGDEKEKSSANSKSDSRYDSEIVEAPAPSTNGDSAAVPSSIAASPYAAAPALSPTLPPKQDKILMLKKFFGWN